MAVRIRLTRAGAKKSPYYRIVVADARSPRDGRFIEQVGTYDPRQSPAAVRLDAERVAHWIGVGALPSQTVGELLVRSRKPAKAAAARP